MASDPTVGPLICGTASYVDGTYVWTDYAYDDTGASEPPSSEAARSRTRLTGRTPPTSSSCSSGPPTTAC